MNIKTRLVHLADVSSRDRRIGRTTLNAKMAKELGGVVIAHNIESARQIEREFGVPAKSVDVNLSGFTGPFLYDHHAVDTMFERAAKAIGERDTQINDLTGEVERLKADVERREAGRIRDAESMAVLADEIGRLNKQLEGTMAVGMIAMKKLRQMQGK